MFIHGADSEKIKRIYGADKDLLDFSSNTNPYLPENIAQHICKNFLCIKNYPDIEYISLRKNIANYIFKKENVFIDEDNICVGNGATELIFLFIRSISGKVGIISPTFTEYARAAKIVGLEVVEIMMNELEDTFEIVVDEQKIKDVEVVFVCNPNNPDGRVRDLSELIKTCGKYGKKIVVDETFIEFCEEYRRYSAINLDYGNIFVIRAVTKFYGIPGLRFGYMMSKNKNYINYIWSIKEPWTVNSIVENLIPVLLQDNDFAEICRFKYKKEREFILSSLKKIDNLKIYKSDSAFLLIKIKNNEFNSKFIKDLMIREYNIIIRDASSFAGLDNSYFRIAIKRRKDNLKIINALEEIFSSLRKV